MKKFRSPVPQFPSSSSSAFTLVELSIVLVIIGLLVGGVLSGKSLIRASELRAVASEFSYYKIAIGNFKDKYSALPGDMRNAVTYWGAAAGSTAISSALWRPPEK